MITVQIFLASLWCLASSKPLVYYITPTPGTANCTVSGNTTLSPCYSLEQLTHDDVLLTTGNSAVTLLLLPGRHVLPENHTLTASNLSEVLMRPWSEQQEVVITCELQAGIVFKDIDLLKVISLHFTFCSIQYTQSERQSNYNKTATMDKFKRFFYVINCLFENSSSNYANDVGITKFELDIIVSHSTYSSNNGAIRAFNKNSANEVPVDMNLLITDSLFRGNWRAGYDTAGCGGALHIEHVNLELNTSHLTQNSALGAGGAISSRFSSLTLHLVAFDKNYVYGRGSSIFLSNFYSARINNCHFLNNLAGLSGGAIYAKGVSGTSLRVSDTIFRDNYAAEEGGAVFVFYVGGQISNCQFRNNSANYGGGIHMQSELRVMTIINSSFTLNKAKTDGGAIFCQKYMIHFINNNFELGYSAGNSAVAGNGGFAYLSQCQALISDGYVISNNKAVRGGAIYATGSVLTFFNTTVADNTARESGGALYLIDSKLDFHTLPLSLALVKFYRNVVTSVTGKGGAVFILDTNCEAVSYPSFQCFIALNSQHFGEYKHLFFSSNIASQGSVIYGGLLDRCFLDNDPDLLGIDNITQISQYDHTPSSVSSDPVRLCLCSDGFKPQCDVRELSLSKRRGEAVDLVGSVVDQDSCPKASIVRAGYNESSADLDKGEGRTKIGNECTNLSYHIFTRDTEATLILQAEGYCERSQFSSLVIHIKITPCSIGFEQSNDRCVCDRRLAKYFNTSDCDIDTDSIKRKGSIWLRYDTQHLKVHKNCPLDYCQVSSDTISFLSPDKQCANHRSGVLCGACQDNYSIALGGSSCLPCTSRYTFVWLMAVFAVAGAALVALLLVCNMTISSGTLNGLIFYANVVSISGLTSLPNCSLHPILSVFIAWLNLDLGVETCFYPGMDTYQKTWLQLVFPLYMWLLVGAIIVASYYSSRAMRVFGRNNIAILATLFLLSYTKFLKTIITALSFTQVFQSHAENVSAPLVAYGVWTYDSNTEYLRGKHVVLFAVVLALLTFLFLPYTLVLIFGQCARSLAMKRRCILRCIHSTAFISVLDAYHAPYTKKHRYWTGFMLLTRCVLLLAFVSSYRDDDDILTNMYITSLVLIAILTLKTCITKVYRNPLVNTLELSFLLNLLVLSATLYHLKGNNVSICKCTSASISISVSVFIGIMTYHSYLQIRKTRFYASITHAILAEWQIRRNSTVPVDPGASYKALENLPTTSHIDIREELLASEDHS